MKGKHVIILVLSLAAAAGAGVTTAIASSVMLAIVDLYLCGHSLPTLSQTMIDAGPIQMSWADSIMLTLATLAALAGGLGMCQARRQRS